MDSEPEVERPCDGTIVFHWFQGPATGFEDRLGSVAIQSLLSRNVCVQLEGQVVGFITLSAKATLRCTAIDPELTTEIMEEGEAIILTFRIDP